MKNLPSRIKSPVIAFFWDARELVIITVMTIVMVSSFCISMKLLGRWDEFIGQLSTNGYL